MSANVQFFISHGEAGTAGTRSFNVYVHSDQSAEEADQLLKDVVALYAKGNVVWRVEPKVMSEKDYKMGNMHHLGRARFIVLPEGMSAPLDDGKLRFATEPQLRTL